MTDNHNTELHDESEIMEAQGAYDPANAEAQSVADADAADEVTVQAAQPSQGMAVGNTYQDPMGMQTQTKAAIMAAMVDQLSKMNKADVLKAYGKMNGQAEEAPAAQNESLNVKVDFDADLNALMSDEATLSEEFKTKAGTIFEAAINSKLSEEITRLEEKYNEELAEATVAFEESMVEKVDSYLNYVVEQWTNDNRLAIQNGLRTEIAEGFMSKLKDLFVESYVEVPESKVDLVDELAEEVSELEEALNKSTANAIHMQEQMEVLYKNIIVREASEGLAQTQVEKLTGLVENIQFESVEDYAQKVATIKESYFTKTAVVAEETEVTEEEAFVAEAAESDTMSQYLTAIKKTSI